MEDFNDFMKGNGKAALNFGMAYYESHQEDTGRVKKQYLDFNLSTIAPMLITERDKII